ncbi:MAG: polysaccharide deacetylase family protein [Desulfuromonas sp.]|nr:polysaccharide deacetylase family protein [Desulfuromonas sp.]
MTSIRYCFVLLVVWLLATGSGWCADQATVFVYHRFGDARYPSTNIAVDVFEQQLAYLKQHHYQVLTVGEIVETMAAGKPLPERCVALTVDDSYQSFMTGAMPLLRRYGYRATLFVNTGSVGAKSYLDWNELRTLQAEGIEIGNHSASHPYFITHEQRNPDGWMAWAAADLNKAQDNFVRELGFQPQLFAYPYGEYSPSLMNLMEQVGFTAALAQQSGVITPTMSRYQLPRFPMGGPFATLEGFRNKLAMKAMPLTVVSPAGPVVGAEDPPVLRFTLDSEELNLSSLRCYVQGQDAVAVQSVAGLPGCYEVVARGPLQGRRNKYTLTAQSRDGKFWYWFSQVWIHP